MRTTAVCGSAVRAWPPPMAALSPSNSCQPVLNYRSATVHSASLTGNSQLWRDGLRHETTAPCADRRKSRRPPAETCDLAIA